MITIDFETEAINGNPGWKPPKPVGVAIKRGSEESKYFAWGHPTGNNCTWEQAKAELAKVWDQPLLFHNSKFDISVAEKYMGLPIPEALNIHDTMFMLFLTDPYSDTLSLKPSAERYLQIPPEERDALAEWILHNVPECRTLKQAGAFISRAPAELVDPYACGDVDRTHDLFFHLEPGIRDNLMWDAYQREQELMPIMLRSERTGVRVDRDKLAADIEVYERSLLQVEDSLRSRLKNDHIEFSKNVQIADALEAAGIVDEKDWLRTPKGRRSTSKESLAHAIGQNDHDILDMLNYRGSIASALQTFARPWYELSEEDGRIHTEWNQVRTHHENSKDSKGSRTGRLSANRPNLMNVTNEIKGNTPVDLPPPPLMREYLLPEEGHHWLKRDFSSQEIRMLAHFEDGELMQAYCGDPELDPHEMARQMVAEITGHEFERKDIKITAFSIIYGSGVRSLAEQLGRPHHEAQLIKDGYLKAMPGVKKLQKIVTNRANQGMDIRTWGGRMYYKEPSKVVRGRKMNFAYKLLNYLIQGSSADQTKQCVIDWDKAKPVDNVFLATVHDEINISAPVDTWKHDMTVLKEYMEQDLFDVPMLSEGFVGPNWYDVKECK